MNILLSPLQQRSLQTLELEFSPSATWLLKVDYGSAEILSPIVKWSAYPLKTERLLLAQRLLTSWWSPSVVTGEASISSTAYRQEDTLVRMLILIEEEFPESRVCELTQDNWIKIWILMLYRVWGNGTDTKTGKRFLAPVKEPLAKQMFERTTTILKLWFYAYQSGEVSDGPEFLLSAPLVEPVLKTTIKNHGHDFEIWKKGGSYGSVPFVIAHLLLADALSIVRSNRVQKMLAYFSVVRETNSHDYLKLFWNSYGKTQIGKYKKHADITILSKTTESDSSDSIANDCKEKFIHPLHKELLATHLASNVDEPFSFPWKTHAEFRAEYNNIQAAIYIIFLSIMGKRGPSEVRTLRGIDITRSNELTGQDALMHPSIWKTNKGARQKQGVTNFIDDVLTVLLRLGYQDKTNTELPLFCALPTLKTPTQELRTLSKDRAQDRLLNYYTEFCQRAEEMVDFDIKALHEKISSHQFRHSFAEFALRRFDGNIEELIRQHFCHRYNHWWTRRYTEDKLDTEHINEVNQRYIRELVPKILFDNTDSPEYVGAVALFIKKRFGETIRVVNANEAEDIITTVCDDIIQVTAHEYGWCLLHKEAYSSAKCSDINGHPQPANTSAEKCTGCANFCASSQSHLAKQTQILLSHMDFIEQKVWKLPSLTKRSRQAIRNAQIVFPQLKAYGEV